MRKVRLSPRARTDMLDIWRYIAADNEPAADRMLDRLTNVMNILAGQPESGRRRPELLGGLRSFPAGTYVILYRIGTLRSRSFAY